MTFSFLFPVWTYLSTFIVRLFLYLFSLYLLFLSHPFHPFFIYIFLILSSPLYFYFSITLSLRPQLIPIFFPLILFSKMILLALFFVCCPVSLPLTLSVILRTSDLPPAGSECHDAVHQEISHGWTYFKSSRTIHRVLSSVFLTPPPPFN